MSIVGKVLAALVEMQGRRAPVSEWGARLANSAEAVAGRLATAPDTAKNRDLAAHIIGIERWGQRRLRMLLGEPPIRDEYDRYRPDAEQNLAALADVFRQTRAETVRVIAELEAAGCVPTTTAPHNDLGNVSIRGWLSYLDGHAAMESRKLR